jgi:hypothetical protein
MLAIFDSKGMSSFHVHTRTAALPDTPLKINEVNNPDRQFFK